MASDRDTPGAMLAQLQQAAFDDDIHSRECVGAADRQAVADRSRALRFAGLGALASFLGATAGFASLSKQLLFGAQGKEENVIPRTGCSNWNDIKLKPVQTGLSLEECRVQCESTSGCHNFNYAPYECGSDSSFPGAMSCYLFGPNCETETSLCWDLYNGTNLSLPYALNQSRTGCSNWAESLLQNPPATGVSLGECATSCDQTPACAHFGYQPSECSAGEGSEAGACHLYGGSCENKTNDCWDLYDAAKALVHDVGGVLEFRATGGDGAIARGLAQTLADGLGIAADMVKVTKISSQTARRLSSGSGAPGAPESHRYGYRIRAPTAELAGRRASQCAAAIQAPAGGGATVFETRLAAHLVNAGCSLVAGSCSFEPVTTQDTKVVAATKLEVQRLEELLQREVDEGERSAEGEFPAMPAK